MMNRTNKMEQTMKLIACLVINILFASSAYAVTWLDEDFEGVADGILPWNATINTGAGPLPAGTGFVSYGNYKTTIPANTAIVAGEGLGGSKAGKFTIYGYESNGGLGNTHAFNLNPWPSGGSGYTEFYSREYRKYSMGWLTNLTGTMKLHRFYIGNSSLIPVIYSTGGHHQIRVFYAGGYPTPTYDGNYSLEAHDDGQFHCWEMHYKLNTPGTSDGVYEFWIDNTLIFQKTDWNARASSSDTMLNISYGIAWGGNASGLPTSFTPFNIWIDNVALADTRIGCGTEPPSSLRIPSPPGSLIIR